MGKVVVEQIVSADAAAAVCALRQQFSGSLVVRGSLTLTDALLRACEVDTLRLRVLPVLLGSGRSFAPPNLGLRPLTLTSTESFPGNLVVLEYNCVR